MIRKMTYLHFCNSNLGSYLFSQLKSGIESMITLSYLKCSGDKTVREISTFLNQNCFIDFGGKTDAYFLLDRLEEWGYIAFVVDQQKYASKVKRCRITDLGMRETAAFADYLSEIQHIIDVTCVQLNC